jgi:hypothetical protein
VEDIAVVGCIAVEGRRHTARLDPQHSLEAAPLGAGSRTISICNRSSRGRCRCLGCRPKAAIYQLEFLLELVNAEASAMIDNFHLVY